jgi:hypothetical protein
MAKKRLDDLKELDDTPPWDWPERTATFLLDALRDPGATQEERLLAADLAGNSVVVNDELVAALLSILRSGEEPSRCLL